MQFCKYAKSFLLLFYNTGTIQPIVNSCMHFNCAHYHNCTKMGLQEWQHRSQFNKIVKPTELISQQSALVTQVILSDLAATP